MWLWTWLTHTGHVAVAVAMHVTEQVTMAVADSHMTGPKNKGLLGSMVHTHGLENRGWKLWSPPSALEVTWPILQPSSSRHSPPSTSSLMPALAAGSPPPPRSTLCVRSISGMPTEPGSQGHRGRCFGTSAKCCQRAKRSLPGNMHLPAHTDALSFWGGKKWSCFPAASVP